MRLKKGSRAAKDYMAKIRTMKKKARRKHRRNPKPTAQQIAKRRLAIKSQIRRAGVRVSDPNIATGRFRTLRHKLGLRPGFFIAAYSVSSGKVAYWNGGEFVLQHGHARVFPTIRDALKVAKAFGLNARLAVASTATPSREIEQRLLTGIRLKPGKK